MSTRGDGLVVGRALVRALLRQARAWVADASRGEKSVVMAAANATSTSTSTSHTPLLAVRAPLATEAWRVGAHGAALAGPEYHEAALRALLGSALASALRLPPGGAWAGGPALRAWILAAARHPSASIDAGLTGLRALQDQRAMERCSSTATTAGVRVEATSVLVGKKMGGGGEGGGGLVLDWGGGSPPAFLPPPDDPEGHNTRWLFTYRLRITHVGGGGGGSGRDGGAAAAPTTPAASPTAAAGHPAVKLLTRAWKIRDGRGRLHAAVPPGSPGLVGATPTLRPGECFEYYSATDLPSPLGVMSGAFGARWVGGDEEGAGGGGARFEVAVAPFALMADPLRAGGGVGGGRGV